MLVASNTELQMARVAFDIAVCMLPSSPPVPFPVPAVEAITFRFKSLVREERARPVSGPDTTAKSKRSN
jgi:hypothetical protein